MKKICILGFIIRIVCIYLFRNIDNYDLQSYLQVGELTLRGVNIYPDIAKLHYPYFPFFLYIETFAVFVKGFGIDPIIFIKIINIIFDLTILQLIYLLSNKNLKTAFYYAINPVTILVTTLHGQFDVIPLFFLLLSIYCLNRRKESTALLFFSLAVLLKTWPLLFVITIWKRLKNRKLIILLFIFPILFVIMYTKLFHSSMFDITKTILFYQGLWGIWGVGKLFFFPIRILLQKAITFVFLISFFVYSLKLHRKTIQDEIFLLLILFFIFTTNFAIQYFVWLIPFLLLAKHHKFRILIIPIAIYQLATYYQWLSCQNCIPAPHWLNSIQNIASFSLWIYFMRTWLKRHYL